jgi:succinate dehydrogenase / fumarate reductase cytochrome b subunit
MKDRYAYYPGCLASLSQKELDSSTRAIARKLEIELVEMPSVTCCGAGDIHEAKPDYYLHISARILGQAEQTGCDTILTICNVCTLNLRQANKALQEDPALLARVNDNLAEVGAATYQGGVDVRHLLWEVSTGEGYERFKKVAVKSLEGLKVAPFYGCQILRPTKILGFEDPDRPESLERLITACGAEPIDYPAKVKCCGFPIVLAREDVALGELVQPLSQAKEAGADVIVTPCPLCHLSLDAWQGKAAAFAGEDYKIPILHLAQLLGAAAGIDESELKFKRHVTRLSTDVQYKLKVDSVVGTQA